MGLLYGNIPAYSGNPTRCPAAVAPTPTRFGKYMDALWGTPLSGSWQQGQHERHRTTTRTSPAQMALQQRGFYNMTQKWFGDAATPSPARGSRQDQDRRALLPVAQGQRRRPPHHVPQDGHRRDEGARLLGPEPRGHRAEPGRGPHGSLRTSTCWSSSTCSRPRPPLATARPTGVTYLIPACCARRGGRQRDELRSYAAVALAGTQACRQQQGRHRAAAPFRQRARRRRCVHPHHGRVGRGWRHRHVGLRRAVRHRSTRTAGARRALPRSRTSRRPSTPAVEMVAATGQRTSRLPRSPAPSGSPRWSTARWPRRAPAAARSGSTPARTTPAATWTTDNIPVARRRYGRAGRSSNRAKSRDQHQHGGTFASHGWGYSWLVNRRVLYNNREVPGDVADFFMGPDSCSRLFVSTNTAVLNYSRWYRTIHRLADMPRRTRGDTRARTSLATSRSPVASRPTPSPTRRLARTGADVGHATPRARCMGPASRPTRRCRSSTTVTSRRRPRRGFPLVLTTIRCVEHFQGGPITRNNWWNVELEPEPWIEINSADARTLRHQGRRLWSRSSPPRIVDDLGARR